MSDERTIQIGKNTLLPDAAAGIDLSNLEGNLVIKVGEREIMRFEANGDIFVHGNLIENDVAVLDGFKEWLRDAQANIEATK